MKQFLMVAIASIAMVSCSKSDIVTPTSSTTSVNSNKRTTSVQCIGFTQSNTRCQNKTLSLNSKCHLHGGN
jgi:hypothetical protein